MPSIIEELYFANIHLNSGLQAKDPTYAEAARLKELNYEELLAALNESEKERFEKFLDADGDLRGIEQYNTFTCAFRLGVLLMIETFTGLSQVTMNDNECSEST